MTDSMTVRFTSRSDILAMPVAMFGFTPRESLVCVRMDGKHVSFCARIDIDAMLIDAHALRRQILDGGAAEGRSGDHWLLLAYTLDPELHAHALEEFAFQIGGVSVIFVTDGARHWELADGRLTDEMWFDDCDSLVAQAAARSGTSELVPWRPEPGWVEDARKLVWGLEPHEQLELLRTLLEAGAPVGKDKAVLACLLGEEECFAECMSQLKTRVAAERRATLMAAREHAPAEAVANVTALVALAAWLEIDSVLMDAALEDLETLHTGHPLGKTLRLMVQLGIPPVRWDEH